MNEINIRNVSENIKNIAENALNFDNYIYRRAWGIYYSIWGLSMSIFVSLPYFLSFSVPKDEHFFFYVIIYSAVGVLSTFYTLRVFSKAREIIRLRKIINRKSGKNAGHFGRNFAGWVIIIILLIFLTVGLHNFLGVSLFFIFAVALDFYIYWTLKESFDTVPIEGRIATFSLGISAVCSFIVGIAIKEQSYFLIAWVPTVVSWFYASLYSFYKAPEDLVNINGY